MIFFWKKKAWRKRKGEGLGKIFREEKIIVFNHKAQRFSSFLEESEEVVEEAKEAGV
jgi:hypothetical protein